MDRSTLRIGAYVGVLLASPTIIVAAARLFVLFGKLSEGIDALKTWATRATDTLDVHGATLTNHGERIARLEERTDL